MKSTNPQTPNDRNNTNRNICICNSNDCSHNIIPCIITDVKFRTLLYNGCLMLGKCTITIIILLP